MSDEMRGLRRLTFPQRYLLADICSGDHHCVEEYRPAMKLVEMGLAEWRSPRKLYPTDRGRTLLAQAEQEVAGDG